MNRATTIYVAVALATAAGAFSMRPPELTVAPYMDQGEALFPDFTDPTAAASLEVIAWDDEAAQVVRFAVEQKGGVWVIPSHHDYPADATEQMGEAAASFIDVKKDLYLGDNPADHAKFGVLDPQGDKGQGDEKGKRITLQDESGKTLVDIIVGKQVPEKPGMYYVRYPSAEGDDQGTSSRRVYASKLDLNITTKFADWIEKDLLKVERDEIVGLTYDPYSVDEQAGRVVGSEPVVAVRGEGEGADWALAPEMQAPAGKALDASKIGQMVNAIAGVRIVGVRPRPEQLTLRDLQSKGFFVSGQPGAAQLFGNEGQASIVTKDGLRYTLFFGEVTYESGLALTAGTEAPKAEEEATGEGAAEAGDDDVNKTASRYMWVDVAYDASADQSLASAPTAEAEGAAVAEAEEGDATASEGEAAEDAKKQAEGRERAEKLSRRFGEWYYVISDSSFKQIRKDRDSLFKEAEKSTGSK